LVTVQNHFLDLAEVPNVEQVRSRAPLVEIDINHVAEIIAAEKID